MLTKKQFWEAMKIPPTAERSCDNCGHFHWGAGYCAVSGGLSCSAVEDKHRWKPGDEHWKPEYTYDQNLWEWNGKYL